MKVQNAVIIGSGPAGYAAAIYLARAQLQPYLLAGEKSGGQLMLTTEIENYPGFSQGIQGPELMMEMRAQAERFGAVMVDREVKQVDFSVKPFMVDDQRSHAVLIATGAESIPIGVPGETEYTGRGVSYCAVCDAAFFREKRVFVVGGGDAAMEDTLALTKFAKKVTIIHRREVFRASKIMQERVLSRDQVDVVWNSEVIEVMGDGLRVTGLTVKNTQTNKTQELVADGVFVAIGHRPATDFLRNQVALDEKGYVKTGITYPSLGNVSGSTFKEGYPTMTSVEGVFGAGDNVDFRYRQAATAAGMGVMAALDIEKWLETGVNT